MSIPQFQIIGLANREVKEASERVRAAIESSGYLFPRKKVIVNLAPANLLKSGTCSDLAIALALLSHSGQIDFNTHWAEPSTPPSTKPLCVVAVGELGLKGDLKGGPNPIIGYYLAKTLAEQGHRVFVFLAQSSLIEFNKNEHSTPDESLTLLFQKDSTNDLLHFFSLKHLNELSTIKPSRGSPLESKGHLPSEALELKVRSQKKKTTSTLQMPSLIAQALTLSAVGQHPLLILGSQGIGKSRALELLQELNPPCDSQTQKERLLLEMSYSAESLGSAHLSDSFWLSPLVKPATLIGKYKHSRAVPGLLARSHGRVLVADEFLEWHRDAKECLRDPLQNYRVILQQEQNHVQWPARFLFAASSNFCPCGGLPEAYSNSKNTPQCKCRHTQVLAYRNRISGPIEDRIDLILPWLPTTDLPPESFSVPPSLAEWKVLIRQANTLLSKPFNRVPQFIGVADWPEPFVSLIETYHSTHPTSSRRISSRIVKIALTLAAIEHCQGRLATHGAQTKADPLEWIFPSMRQLQEAQFWALLGRQFEHSADKEKTFYGL